MEHSLTTVAQWSRLQTAVGCEDLRGPGHGTRPVSANQRPRIPGIDQWEYRDCVSNPPESPHFVSVCSLKAGSVSIWEIHVAFTLPCTFNVSEGGYRKVEMEKGRVGKWDYIETREERMLGCDIILDLYPLTAHRKMSWLMRSKASWGLCNVLINSPGWDFN